jgi:hypothetical protein
MMMSTNQSLRPMMMMMIDHKVVTAQAVRRCFMPVSSTKLMTKRSMVSATANMPKFSGMGGGTGASNNMRNKNFDDNLKWWTQVAAIGVGVTAMQTYLGNGEDFFEHKFKTTADPQDLASFYGTEDFMEIFCVFPFMVKLMMRGAEFDEEGNIRAFGLSGRGGLQISIDFDEKEADIDGDGEPDTLIWFNKREHFHESAPSFLGGFTLWDLTQNFGYHRLEDGTCEVYHNGEKFHGMFLIRLIFQIHAQYVIWATEKYVNSSDFGTADREEELEEQRHNIPLHVFKEFIEGLTVGLERARKQNKGNDKKVDEINVTIQRLQTTLNKTIEENEAGIGKLPRLRTMKSHNTISRVHLEVDDKETQDAIRTAMQQIGSTPNGHSNHLPVSNMHRLTRRATRAGINIVKGEVSNPHNTSDIEVTDNNIQTEA